MTTCFVFDEEFPIVFSISREAYDQLMDDYKFYPVSEHYCSFCEERSGVRQITGFAQSTFFSDMFLCHKCYHRIKDKVNEQD